MLTYAFAYVTTLCKCQINVFICFDIFFFSICEAVNIISTYLSIFNEKVHSMMLTYKNH